MRLPKGGTQRYREELRKMKVHPYYNVEKQNDAGFMIILSIITAFAIIVLAMAV